MPQESQQGDTYPHASSEAVTAVMKGNRRVDTKPEVQLRSALHRRGRRFRKDLAISVGGARKPRPDIVFSGPRLAVFIDGCFWHRCPDHGRVPGGPNAGYWSRKLARNHARDKADSKLLEEAGWRVLRIWEHVPIAEAIDKVELALRS